MCVYLNKHRIIGFPVAFSIIFTVFVFLSPFLSIAGPPRKAPLQLFHFHLHNTCVLLPQSLPTLTRIPFCFPGFRGCSRLHSHLKIQN